MELKRVLLIEDDVIVRQKVLKEFEDQGIELIEIEDFIGLESQIDSLGSFQMVVLDWLLDGESNTDALLCLATLRKICFVPIVVWTEEL